MEYSANKSEKLIKFMIHNIQGMSFGNAQKLIRLGKVKVNGSRCKENIDLQVGDIIFVFETIIEMLSFITLQKQFDFASADKGRVYLSLEGLRFDALNALLEKYPSITKVIFCLGNDTDAIDAVKKFASRRGLSVFDYQPMLRDYSLKHHFVVN